MLSIRPGKLTFIIEKAREFDAKSEPSDDGGSNPIDDGERGVLEASPDNRAEAELVDAIGTLDDGERAELVALTWLGRGDYGKSEWREALRDARRRHSGREAAHLLGTPLLADYIEEGLAELGCALEGNVIRPL